MAVAGLARLGAASRRGTGLRAGIRAGRLCRRGRGGWGRWPAGVQPRLWSRRCLLRSMRSLRRRTIPKRPRRPDCGPNAERLAKPAPSSFGPRPKKPSTGGNLGEGSSSPPSKSQRGRRRPPLPEGGLSPKAQDMDEAVGRRDAPRYRQRLNQAEVAYEQDDYHKAWRALDGMAKDAPNVPEVRELAGLTLYRLGRWELAARELEAFRELTGRTDLHPVLADCHRAQERWADVDELWAELRASEVSTAILIEGRIVAAGALGDRGDLTEAVRLLSANFQRPRRAKEHHMRRPTPWPICANRPGRFLGQGSCSAG